jgi:hypothetical protein
MMMNVVMLFMLMEMMKMVMVMEIDKAHHLTDNL